MTSVEFLELLKKYSINEKLMVFNDTMKKGYCVRKNYFRWEVFFRGREKNMIAQVFLQKVTLCNTYLINFTTYT